MVKYQCCCVSNGTADSLNNRVKSKSLKSYPQQNLQGLRSLTPFRGTMNDRGNKFAVIANEWR